MDAGNSCVSINRNEVAVQVVIILMKQSLLLNYIKRWNIGIIYVFDDVVQHLLLFPKPRIRVERTIYVKTIRHEKIHEIPA